MYNTHFQGKCGHTRKKKKRFTCDHTCKVCVIQSYLFWISYNVNNMNTQIKEKVLARLGRLRLQGALAPANFILNLRFKMKKPCYFPVDFVYCRENRYSEFLFYLTVQKSWSSANIGRANVVCRVRWANIWTRSVHYITLLCIWPHIKNFIIT